MLTFSTDTWGDATDRDQIRPPGRLVQTLVDSPDLRRLLVANPPRQAAITAAKRLLGRSDPPIPTPVNGEAALTQPVAWRRDNPTTVASAERVMRRYDRHLARAARCMGMDRPTVVTFNPLVAGFCPLEWAGTVAYYARDDWSRHPRFAPWHAVIEAADHRLVERGVRVAAVSGELLSRFGGPSSGTVVANGIDPDEWALDDAPPAREADPEAPQLVYTGTLDDRLDLDALIEVAERHPGARITLVGPPRADLRRVLACPNVRVAQPQERARVIDLVVQADVCLIPHHRTPLTEAMNPLKLYEYLAAGKPVAATDLAGSRGIHPKVHLTEGGRSFADTVLAALADGPMPEDERRAFVRDNTWQQRHDALFRFLQDEHP